MDTEEQNTGNEDEPLVMKNLNAARELFTQTFYKAGDTNCRMHVYADPGEDGDVFRSDTLNLLFSGISPHFAAIADQDILAVNADAAIKTVPDGNV